MKKKPLAPLETATARIINNQISINRGYKKVSNGVDISLKIL
jgi:hypothetical protein